MKLAISTHPESLRQQTEQNKELPMSVRRYLAVLKGRISIEMAIHNREQLVECLDYLWDYVLPFSDTYSADDISSLLTDKDFLTEYKLNDVIAYL